MRSDYCFFIVPQGVSHEDYKNATFPELTIRMSDIRKSNRIRQVTISLELEYSHTPLGKPQIQQWPRKNDNSSFPYVQHSSHMLPSSAT